MKNPNIIYILTDDLGFGDLSCYGAKHYQTKNIDRLAEEGLIFTDAHSSSAVCTPSRYSLLTGRYAWRGRLKKGVLLGHDEPLIEKGRMTVASFLKQYRYKTACIGKWHLGLGWAKDHESPTGVDYSQPITDGPLEYGFDYFFGISASLDMPPYCFIENDRTVGIPSVPKDPIDFSQQDRGGYMVPGWKDEDVNGTLTEKALEFIENHLNNDPDDPFYLYLPLTGPHTPWSPSEPFQGKSGIGPRADLVLEIDDTVGQLLELLEEKGIRDETLFIFTSDNGPDPFKDEITIHSHEPVGPLRGQKADIWEGGHRVPFIASWPERIPKGTKSSQLMCLSDFLATCAAIVGGELPKDAGEDSINMLPDWEGKSIDEPLRDSVILHSIDGTFSLRKGDWKYIRGAGSGGFQLKGREIIGIPHTKDREVSPDSPKEQLYQLRSDIGERRNRVLDEPERLVQMREELDRLIEAGRTRLV